MVCKQVVLSILAASLFSSTCAAQAFVGPNGINSAGTGLTGEGVIVGQFETYRTGDPDIDINAATGMPIPEAITIGVDPAAVFFGTGLASGGFGFGTHSNQVSEVIIGIGAVAQDASLYSASAGAGDNPELITIASLARRNAIDPDHGDRVRVINLSWSKKLTPFVQDTDGNSPVTQLIDWSAKENDVTYVSAWPNDNFLENVDPASPHDNFNGITVAAAFLPDGTNDVTYALSGADPRDNSIDADGDRTSIDIIAPGGSISLTNPINDESVMTGGSSFAAPHVSGTVALLQEYANNQIEINNPNFHPNRSRNHLVMKSVIMNSADKISGVHGSNKNVFAYDNSLNLISWDETQASTDPDVPIDRFIGSGFLNAKRALDQYQGGEQDGDTASEVGWAFGETGGIGDQLEYLVTSSGAGEWMALTLVWDRVVTPLFNGSYGQGDQFATYNDLDDVLSDLNLFLFEPDETILTEENAIAKSTSSVFSVEHIFFQSPGAGDYKVVVKHDGNLFSQSDGSGESQVLDAQTDFALAWWAFQPDPFLLGDANGDGVVDGADLIAVQTNFGSVNPPPGDANGDGVVDGADLIAVQTNFGNTLSVTVPEPTSFLIALLAIAAATIRRPRG